LWNSTVSSRSMNPSSGCCRSASQKNRASRSRAVSTRSRFRDTTSGFSGSVLSTARNTGNSFPWSLRIGKKC
jgi:hypothetical protein